MKDYDSLYQFQPRESKKNYRMMSFKKIEKTSDGGNLDPFFQV